METNSSHDEMGSSQSAIQRGQKMEERTKKIILLVLSITCLLSVTFVFTGPAIAGKINEGKSNTTTTFSEISSTSTGQTAKTTTTSTTTTKTLPPIPE